jgi:hypothetical protein
MALWTLRPPPGSERARSLALLQEHERRPVPVTAPQRVWMGVTGGLLAADGSETLAFDWRQVPEVLGDRWALVRLQAAVRGSAADPHLEVDSAASGERNLAINVLLRGPLVELVTPLPASWGGTFELLVTNRSGVAAVHRVVAALERWDAC